MNNTVNYEFIELVNDSGFVGLMLTNQEEKYNRFTKYPECNFPEIKLIVLSPDCIYDQVVLLNPSLLHGKVSMMANIREKYVTKSIKDDKLLIPFDNNLLDQLVNKKRWSNYQVGWIFNRPSLDILSSL
jgi:hypothetical protein